MAWMNIFMTVSNPDPIVGTQALNDAIAALPVMPIPGPTEGGVTQPPTIVGGPTITTDSTGANFFISGAVQYYG